MQVKGFREISAHEVSHDKERFLGRAQTWRMGYSAPIARVAKPEYHAKSCSGAPTPDATHTRAGWLICIPPGCRDCGSRMFLIELVRQATERCVY